MSNKRKRRKVTEVLRVDLARSVLESGKPISPEQSLRLRRIAIAAILRVGRRPDGRELTDVAVATRVVGAVPSEVARVRAELDAHGVIQEEVEHRLPGEGGAT